MAKNFEVIVYGGNQSEIESKVKPVFKTFINNSPKKSHITLKLDLTNTAGVRGILEYDCGSDDFQSAATGNTAEEVSLTLIMDIESKLHSWTKSVA